MPTVKIQGEEVEIEFYREEVNYSSYQEEKKPAYVNMDDAEDVISNSVRLEMSPGKRRRYVKIEDIPFKVEPRTASEAAFNGDDAEDDDYELTDEEADAALVSTMEDANSTPEGEPYLRQGN